MVKHEQLAAVAAGHQLLFAGYAETPTEGVILTKGAKVVYVSHEIDGEGLDIVVEADNPKFNPKVRPSAKNPAKVEVHLFENEVDFVEAPAAKGRTKAPAKAATKEEAPATTAPKGRAKAPAKAAAKTEEAPATTAPKGRAKAPAKTEEAPATKGRAKTSVKAETKAPAKEEVYTPDVDALKTEDQEVLALVNGAGSVEDLVHVAIDTINESMNNDYTLGGLIHHMRLSGSFVNYGEEGKYSKANGGFKAFCEEVLDFSYRKAKYFSNIYYQFNKLGIAGNKVAEIGWTKAMKIAEAASMGDTDENALAITKADATKLIALAKKSTVDELDDHIKTQYRKPNTTTSEKFKKIPFSLPDARASIILNHIESAKDMFETDSRDEAIARIIEDWADQNVGEA